MADPRMDLRCPEGECDWGPRPGPPCASHLALGLWLQPPRGGRIQFVAHVALVQKAAACYLTYGPRGEIKLWSLRPACILTTSWETTYLVG